MSKCRACNRLRAVGADGICELDGVVGCYYVCHNCNSSLLAAKSHLNMGPWYYCYKCQYMNAVGDRGFRNRTIEATPRIVTCDDCEATLQPGDDWTGTYQGRFRCNQCRLMCGVCGVPGYYEETWDQHWCWACTPLEYRVNSTEHPVSVAEFPGQVFDRTWPDGFVKQYLEDCIAECRYPLRYPSMIANVDEFPQHPLLDLVAMTANARPGSLMALARDAWKKASWWQPS
jgi:hypothetical protein